MIEITDEQYAHFGKVVAATLGSNYKWDSAADYLSMFAERADAILGVPVGDQTPKQLDFWRNVADDVGAWYDRDSTKPGWGYAFHVGIEAGLVETAASMMKPHHTSIDGDGWEAWGEEPTADANVLNPSARHLVIYSNYYESTIESIKERIGHLLLPMRLERQRDVILVVTEPEEWSARIDDPYITL